MRVWRSSVSRQLIMSGYDGVNEGEERANYYRVVELSISSKLKIWKTLKMVL